MTLAGGALAVLLGGVLLVANCPEADLESPVGAASSLESSGDGEGTGAPTDGTSAPDLGDHGAADQATQPPTEPPEPVFTIEPAPELPIRSVLARPNMLDGRDTLRTSPIPENSAQVQNVVTAATVRRCPMPNARLTWT